MFDCLCQYYLDQPCPDCLKTIQSVIDGPMVNQIKVYADIQLMGGVGEEWLVDAKGDVRAVFIDGNLKCQILYMPNNETTKVA